MEIPLKIDEGDIAATKTLFPAAKWTPPWEKQVETATQLANDSEFQKAVVEAYEATQNRDTEGAAAALQKKDEVAQAVLESGTLIDAALTTSASKAIASAYAKQKATG